MSAAFDAWLAWQAEIGTDEVLLAAPLALRPRRAAAAASSVEPGHPAADAPPPGHRPAVSGAGTGTGARTGDAASVPPAPTAKGADFFATIAAELARSTPRAAPRKPARADTAPETGAPPSPLSPLATALAGLSDTNALRDFLAAEYPRWFPDAPGPLAAPLGHAAPRLAVVELAPGPDGVFGGDAGALLDRMLGAIGLARDDLYLTAVMKTPPPGGRAWARRDVARMLPVLTRELTLARCELVLVMGETCAQAVLKTGRALPELSGSAVTTDGLVFSATWHPADLLADESRKKPAWEHLKWLQTRLPRKA